MVSFPLRVEDCFFTLLITSSSHYQNTNVPTHQGEGGGVGEVEKEEDRNSKELLEKTSLMTVVLHN